MNIYNQFCTYAQAQRLKELGITAPALFTFDRHGKLHYGPMGINAYGVAELGVMMPSVDENVDECYITMKDEGSNSKGIDIEGFAVWELFTKELFKPEGFLIYPSEAEARAAMIIYLLKNNLCTPEEVNQRLIAA